MLAGLADIFSKFVKKFKEEVIAPLTNFIKLKTSELHPKHENVLITLAGTYRSISLLTNFSKIIEGGVLNRRLN